MLDSREMLEKVCTFLINPLTPKISLVILLTVCRTVLVMLVWRIWCWIKLWSLNWYFLYSHQFSAWHCIDILRRISVLVTHGSWRVNVISQCLLSLLYLLSPFTPKSVCTFSILFFIHFLRCLQGEFVYWSKAFIGDHFLYSHFLNVWFRDDIVGIIWC